MSQTSSPLQPSPPSPNWRSQSSDSYWKVEPYRWRITKTRWDALDRFFTAVAGLTVGLVALGTVSWLIQKKFKQITIPLERAPKIAAFLGRTNITLNLSSLHRPLLKAGGVSFGVNVLGVVLGVWCKLRDRAIDELKIPPSSLPAAQRIRFVKDEVQSYYHILIATAISSVTFACADRVGYAWKRVVESLKGQAFADTPYLRVYESLPKNWERNQLFDGFGKVKTVFTSISSKSPLEGQLKESKDSDFAKKSDTQIWTACFAQQAEIFKDLENIKAVKSFEMPGVVLQMPGLAFLAAQCTNNFEKVILNDSQIALITGLNSYADVRPDVSTTDFLKMSEKEVDALLPLKTEEKRLFVLPLWGGNLEQLRTSEQKEHPNETYKPFTSEQLTSLYKPVYNAFFHIKQAAGDKKVVVRTGNWAVEGQKGHGSAVISMLIQMMAAKAAQIHELEYLVEEGDEPAFKQAQDVLVKLQDKEGCKQKSIAEVIETEFSIDKRPSGVIATNQDMRYYPQTSGVRIQQKKSAMSSASSASKDGTPSSS